MTQADIDHEPSEQAIARRRLLIEATISAISGHGFSNITLAKIAGLAGLTAGTVNFYFESKQSLLLATLRCVAEEFETVVEEAVGGQEEATARLTALIDVSLSDELMTFDKVAVWYAFMSEASSRADYHEICGKRERRYAALIGAECSQIVEAAGRASEINAVAIGRAICGLIDDVWQNKLFEKDEFDASKAKNHCYAFLASVFPWAFQMPGCRELKIAGDSYQLDYTLPAWIYHSESFFDLEQEKIFLSAWQLVCHESDLVKPGSYMTYGLLNRRAFVVRTRSGEIKAFHNVCRHRGTRLCTKPSGNLSKSIQCGYHGWTYDLQGNLIGAPNMDAVADFDMSDYPLNKVQFEEWEGFIFINLADAPIQFESEFSPIMNRFSEWGIPDLKLIESKSYSVNCNWKLIIQNFSECYHCPIIHPQLADITPYTGGRNDLVSGAFLGGYMEMKKETISESGHLCGPLIGNLSPENMNRVYYYTLFPNMLLSLHPDYIMLHTVWPEAVGECRIECYWFFSGEVNQNDKFHPENAINFWDKTNQQDWDICEKSYLGIQSRKYKPGPYSGQESLLAAYDEHYLSMLNKD